MCPFRKLSSRFSPWLLSMLPAWGDCQSLPEALPLWALWESSVLHFSVGAGSPGAGLWNALKWPLRDPLLVSSPLPLCLLQPAPLPKAHIARATLPLFTTFSFLHPCSQRMLIWQCPLITGLLGTAPSSSAKGILGSSAPVLGRLSRCSPSGNWGGGPASSHIPRHGLQDGTWEWLTKCQGC